VEQPRSLRQKKDAAAKRALYEAAMDLFRKKGYESTSVEEIADQAGFSRASFFNHFGTKDGVLRYYGQQLLETIERLLEDRDHAMSPMELIRLIIFTMAKEASRRRSEVRFILKYSGYDKNYLVSPTPSRARIWAILALLVLQCQEQRLIRDDIPAKDIVLHMLSVYHGMVWAIVSENSDVELLLNSSWNFIMGGMSGEGAGTTRHNKR